METIKITSESVGSIIGKGGSKIKEIQTKSGAKCVVDSINLFVKVTGSNHQRNVAKELIQEILNNTVIVYSHPEKVYSVICHPKISKNSIVEFKTFNGEVENPERKETFYTISIKEGEEEEINLRSLSIREPKHKTFYLEKDLSKLEKELVDLVIEKKGNPLHHEIMVTFGTTTFYESRKYFKKTLGLDEFLNSSIGVNEDFKSKYHSLVSEKFADNVSNYLVEELKFKKKTSGYVTFHLVDSEKKERVSLSVQKEENGKMELRSVTSDQRKHIFINYLMNLEFDTRLVYYTKEQRNMNQEFKDFIKEYEKNPKITPNLKSYKIDRIRDHQGMEFNNEDFNVHIYKIVNSEYQRYEVQIESVKIIESLKQDKDISKDEMIKLIANLCDFSKRFLKMK